MVERKRTKEQTMIYNTKDWATSFPLKTGCEYRCSGKVGSSSPTSGILYFIHIEWKITYIMKYVYIIHYILIHIYTHIKPLVLYFSVFYSRPLFSRRQWVFYWVRLRSICLDNKKIKKQKKTGWILCFSFTSINV